MVSEGWRDEARLKLKRSGKAIQNPAKRHKPAGQDTTPAQDHQGTAPGGQEGQERQDDPGAGQQVAQQHTLETTAGTTGHQTSNKPSPITETRPQTLELDPPVGTHGDKVEQKGTKDEAPAKGCKTSEKKPPANVDSVRKATTRKETTNTQKQTSIISAINNMRNQNRKKNHSDKEKHTNIREETTEARREPKEPTEEKKTEKKSEEIHAEKVTDIQGTHRHTDKTSIKLHTVRRPDQISVAGRVVYTQKPIHRKRKANPKLSHNLNVKTKSIDTYFTVGKNAKGSGIANETNTNLRIPRGPAEKTRETGPGDIPEES